MFLVKYHFNLSSNRGVVIFSSITPFFISINFGLILSTRVAPQHLQKKLAVIYSALSIVLMCVPLALDLYKGSNGKTGAMFVVGGLVSVVVFFAMFWRKLPWHKEDADLAVQPKSFRYPRPFFAWHGRIRRGEYLLSVVSILAIKIAAIIFIINRPSAADFLKYLDILMVYIAATTGRRMEDFGVSAVWAWVSIFLFSFVLPIIMLTADKSPHLAAPALPIASGWQGQMPSVLLFLLLIGVGVKKGDSGENRYGGTPV